MLLSPSDCHDDHQAGNRLSGIRGRDIKKNQAIPGEWAPSSLVSVIGRRMSFQRAKLSDILLDNEQVVSIYKERIFIPPLVPLQNVVAYNIIGRRRQTDEAHDGGTEGLARIAARRLYYTRYVTCQWEFLFSIHNLPPNFFFFFLFLIFLYSHFLWKFSFIIFKFRAACCTRHGQ